METLKNLSDEWNIIIFHGKLNRDYVNNIISHKLNNYKDRISTVNLNVNNLTITEYSTLFKIKEWYLILIRSNQKSILELSVLFFRSHFCSHQNNCCT